VIAVVGLSADWYRPSYFAAKYMQEHGYRVIPVNPKYPEILGEKCYRRCATIAGEGRHGRRVPQDAGRHADRRGRDRDRRQGALAAAGVKTRRRPRKARAAGLETVMDRCVKIEHGGSSAD
jgi:predicted CoA-binding protein